MGRIKASKVGKKWYVKESEIQKLFDAGENIEEQQRWKRIQSLKEGAISW